MQNQSLWRISLSWKRFMHWNVVGLAFCLFASKVGFPSRKSNRYVWGWGAWQNEAKNEYHLHLVLFQKHKISCVCLVLIYTETEHSQVRRATALFILLDFSTQESKTLIDWGIRRSHFWKILNCDVNNIQCKMICWELMCATYACKAGSWDILHIIKCD